MNRVCSTALAAALVCLSTFSGVCAQRQSNYYQEILTQVSKLSGKPTVRAIPFGRSCEGRPIPAFVISNFSADSSGKIRILILSGQHGDEYNPIKSVMALSEKLADNKYPKLIRNCVFIIVPATNPEGIAAFSRFNSEHIDINRDWISKESAEARFISRLISTWKPQLLIDAHEWTEPTARSGNSIEVAASDNIRQRLSMSVLASRIGKVSNLRQVACSQSSNPRLFHRYYSRAGYAAYLIETEAGLAYSRKKEIYTSAIISAADALASAPGTCLVLSPKSADFVPATVKAYLEPPPVSSRINSDTACILAMIIGCCALMFIARSRGKDETYVWQRRFLKCETESDIQLDPLLRKRMPLPLTCRSWVEKRTRLKYTERRRPMIHPRTGTKLAV